MKGDSRFVIKLEGFNGDKDDLKNDYEKEFISTPSQTTTTTTTATTTTTTTTTPSTNVTTGACPDEGKFNVISRIYYFICFQWFSRDDS